ncbi:hypothetical protein KBC55_02955 [Patescibacteria group bacterium]|nr:hypothetical protein [Patescibacteria group bacterium]
MRTLIVKLFLSLLVAFFWLWLFLQYAQLDGERVLVWRPGEESTWLHSPLPSDRLSDVQSDGRGAFVIVEDEPLYFTVTPPYGDFDAAQVEVVFLEGGTPLFELGALKDLFAQAYDLVPMFHAGLEGATGERVELVDGVAALYIPADGESMASAVVSNVSPAQVATYRAAWPVQYREGARAALDRFYTSEAVLFGAHEAYVYVQEGTITLELTASDANLVYGQDDVVVALFDAQGSAVSSATLVDDGDISTDGILSDARVIQLSATNLSEGVYRLVLTATSDIRFANYEITTGKFAFKNRVQFDYDDEMEIFTTARSVVIEPLSAEALGQVRSGSLVVELARVGEKYEVELDGDALLVPGGLIRITGDGTFAFHERALFSPQSPPLGMRFPEDVGGAVLARLPDSQLSESGVREAIATWPLSSLATERGAYKFLISVPKVSSYEESLRLYEIRVTLTSDVRGFDRFTFMTKKFIKQIFGL